MDWNEKYRERDTPWDRGEPAPPLVEYVLNNPLEGRVLVPGCGIGHDARFLAEQGCDVHGIDISPIALQKAANTNRLTDSKLRFEISDFLDPENGLPREKYDILVEHTCFCAIDPRHRAAYVQAASKVLKPDGQFLGIFFTHLEDGDGPPYPTTHAEIAELFSPHFTIIDHWRPARVFPGRENEESMYRMQRRHRKTAL